MTDTFIMAEKFPDDFLYDSRLIERHIARGVITRKEAEAFAMSKPDLVDQAETINLDQISRPAAKR